MEIAFTIKIDEDTEITLSEEQVRTLYIKLEELFNNNSQIPIYPYKPIEPLYKIQNI